MRTWIEQKYQFCTTFRSNWHSSCLNMYKFIIKLHLFWKINDAVASHRATTPTPLILLKVLVNTTFTPTRSNWNINEYQLSQTRIQIHFPNESYLFSKVLLNTFYKWARNKGFWDSFFHNLTEEPDVKIHKPHFMGAAIFLVMWPQPHHYS